ncbi:11266_t:CDS:2 [Entrophospora sp. SA101]|nr:11266_t:CDS:2 [Entrophospora sp. SA101]
MNMIEFDKTELAKLGVQFEKIINSCQAVSNYLKSLIERRKKILFLATKKQTQEIVKEQAIKCGGFLTNFPEISKKLKELQGLNNFLQKDTFKNLIKKEQASLEKRRNKLQNIYEGVINLRGKPDALFIIGLNKEKTALREAKKAGIPVIAVCNTNCNPYSVDYVIPGNDESIKSISFFASLIADAINEIGENNGKEQEEKIGEQE